jgi:hypothetical protein
VEGVPDPSTSLPLSHLIREFGMDFIALIYFLKTWDCEGNLFALSYDLLKK